MPLTRKTDANPTELASVVFGLLHYEECRLSAIAHSAKARFHRGKLGGVCAILSRSRFGLLMNGFRDRFHRP